MYVGGRLMTIMVKMRNEKKEGGEQPNRELHEGEEVLLLSLLLLL
jgi:hypothetical protein